jgi:predicted transcriptional regulator
MYSTNLSWRPLTLILSALEKQGLIKTTASDDEKSRVLYEITEKGENVLAYFKEFNNIIKEEPLSILG